MLFPMRALPAIGFCTSEIENLRPPVRLAPRGPEDARTSLGVCSEPGWNRDMENKKLPNAAGLAGKVDFCTEGK